MKIKIFKQKKILRAVQKLPAKQHSQSSPIWVKMGWIACATIQQVTSKRLPQFFFSYFQDFFLNDFIKNPQTRNGHAFFHLIFQLQVVCDLSKSGGATSGSDRPAYILDLAHSLAIMLPSDPENQKGLDIYFYFVTAEKSKQDPPLNTHIANDLGVYLLGTLPIL